MKNFIVEKTDVDEMGVRFACVGARGGGERRGEIEVDPKRRSLRRSLRHHMSHLALESVEESRAFGEDIWSWCLILY